MKKIETTMLKGKKVKDLSVAERDYLEKTISGDYRGEGDQRLKVGKTEVTIDFENGLAVSGWIVWEGDYIYYEFDEEAEIYDPAK